MDAKPPDRDSLALQVRAALTTADALRMADVALYLNEALVILDGVGDAGEAGDGLLICDQSDEEAA
ncbi:hypothetical protein M0208_06855 [Sphingomonas sp. SUN019]|uniref:hypothetical protein n=1 Tax=Sphingomonas sp. SUN019 TaxID=2937788 RepID=UPI0021642998|nr:hypothetical protein [Sphingomonas sp. SUN019]UVO50252.1 hypothetical protein M0208_06855 [Sphingomonas sp. SUN019]